MASDTSKNLGVYADAVDNVVYASYVNAKDMVLLTNKSGGDVVTGDVLVMDTSTTASFTTSTTLGDLRPVYVVPQTITGAGSAATKTIANNEAGWVYKIGAYVPAASVSAAVAIGEYLKVSGTAKKFVGSGVTLASGQPAPMGACAIALNSTAGAGSCPVLLIPTMAWQVPSCRVYHNATQTITQSAITALAFNSERHDNDSMHDTVTNNSRITFNKAGIYLIGASLNFVTASNPANLWIKIRLDGTTEIAVASELTVSTVPREHTLSCIYQVTAGQYVEIAVQNTLTTDAIAQQNGNGYPEFWAIWLSD
jgi:hypothetical protein